MVQKLIYAGDGSEWGEKLLRQTSDIYFTAKYHLYFEKSMKRRAVAFTYNSNGESFFYPFMLGEVGKIGSYTPSKNYQDTETVYGYSGPLSTTSDQSFIQEAYASYYQYCAENNIICGLLRFHPLLETQKLKCEKTNLLLNRRTVSIDLTNVDNLWKSYHPKLRNDIRQAEKMGLEVFENDLDLQQFAQYYENTMKRLDAPEFYYFERGHYDLYKDKKIAKMLSVHKDGEFVAASIFLLHDKSVHYHLSANSGSEYQAYASKLIIHQMALWGIDHGYTKFHLGGGRTPQPDDNLLFFKKRFSDQLHDFYIGKTVLDTEAYKNLCDAWRNQANYEPLPLLQIYRLPVLQPQKVPVKVAS